MDANSALTPVNTTTSAGSLESVIDAVETLYFQIDRETAAFSAATGVACPGGCGRCCAKESVEATLLEMLPMARALFRSGLVDIWADSILAAPSPGRCLVFEPDAAVDGNGRCRWYGWRPLVCRLFGFAARKDKHGIAAFRACRELVNEGAPLVAALAVSNGLAVPVFASYHLQISSLHATLGSPFMAANKAFQQAVNLYGLTSQMTSSDSACSNTPQDDPHCGPEGRMPPLLAA